MCLKRQRGLLCSNLRKGKGVDAVLFYESHGYWRGVGGLDFPTGVESFAFVTSSLLSIIGIG